jgi:hypothetical protein
MASSDDSFDPSLVQARWLLGGVEPEELVAMAILALQHGYSGSALQQLAGLHKPARRDLGNLPESAFSELGLKSLDSSQAVQSAVERYIPDGDPLILDLLKSFPAFAPRWEKYLADSGGKSDGSYIDIAEFVHFVVEDLFETGQMDEVRKIFAKLENFLITGDEETKGFVVVGFLETLQNVASWKPYGNRAFEQFLGPNSQLAWNDLKILWQGKSSLADVIRAERLGEKKPK